MSTPHERYTILRTKHGNDALQTLLAAVFMEHTNNPDSHMNVAKVPTTEDAQFFVQSVKRDDHAILAFKNKPRRTENGTWIDDGDIRLTINSNHNYWLADNADTTILTRAEVLEIYNFVIKGEGTSTSANENDVENW